MISVCIITKNEESHLEQCLKHLKPTGFEIVVVDTGSTDNSVEIAKKYTESVYRFEWCDDFSAARNYSIAKASNDIILVLDTDEYLEKYDLRQLEYLIVTNPDKVGRIDIINEYISDGNVMINNDKVTRLFDRRRYHFEGRIHEQIVKIIDDGSPNKAYNAPLKIRHYGYVGSEEARKKKASRNISLLKSELEKNPSDPYIMYQIGKSYFYIQDYENAVAYFEKATEIDIDLRLDYVSDLVVTYGYSLMNSGNIEKAMLLEGLYDDFCKNADYLFMLALAFMKNGKFDIAVDLFHQATKCENASVEGVNSYLAFYNIGVIYECLGDKKTAISYYKRCGDFELAKKGIERC